MSKGKIVKVSGPLVVAEGLGNVKMYEVVRVGEKKLIGEVLELKDNFASIQVYEETSGVGPNEPVFATGLPLSVELGPGLIGSIYDGIQRPLDIIAKTSGDFITRGIDVPALNREKIWHFVPSLKNGDMVTAGDILGEVQETSLIKQKIMVPIGVEGKIVKISEGDFTVEQTVCEIHQSQLASDKSTVISISLMQKWPVRKQRLYREKLPPMEMLVTGQRVIDTFFPVAKGGTACIPGPFGSGKCLTGKTPVLLADGTLLPIKEIFKICRQQGKKFKNQVEEYTVIKVPLSVFSYKDGKIIKTKAVAVYKGKTPKIIRIKTRTGRIAEVTPIHKLLKVNPDLTVTELESQKLKQGDYLLTPRYLDLKSKIQQIDVNEIFQESRLTDKRILKQIPELLGQLILKYGTLKEVAQKLNTSYELIIEYYHQRNKPTVKWVEKLFSLSRKKCPEILSVKGERQSKKVKVHQCFDKPVAIFLGLLLGDGTIKQNSVRFYNNDEKIQSLFKELVKNLFVLTVKRTIVNTVKCSIVESSILVRFLKYFGYPEYKKSQSCSLPKELFISPIDVIGVFLGAYFICDGYFNTQKGEIEYTTASKKMQTGLSYLLLRLGLLHRCSTKIVNKTEYYRVHISGRKEIEKFYRYCIIPQVSSFEKMKQYLYQHKKGYTNVDTVPLDKDYLKEIYHRAGCPYTCMKNRGIEIHNYLSGELMSKDVFVKFSRSLQHKKLLNIATNHLSEFYYDRITEITEINRPCEVYDLEVPETHNFIGGYAPMIYHNTVVQHQLSKWSDADIIVFVGCGERGNEMADVLLEFPKLKDPKTNEPLIKRTVLIGNTSNMPVSARESSVYTGITIAEYFRDMGYTVALMADSTSRWAEALREISGRLEEMPGDEGYPAYLSTRLAEFYERAGKVICLGSDKRVGALTVIGSVSPPGGDLSDPVVQATLRLVKVFWSLEDKLAFARHFPAISWLRSYSLYIDSFSSFLSQNIADDFLLYRKTALCILQEESSLEEIVRLVGIESLTPLERLILISAKSIREDFLHQIAFDPEDTYTSLKKQYRMLKIIILLHNKCEELLSEGTGIDEIASLSVRQKVAWMKFFKDDDKEKFDLLEKEVQQ